MSQGFGAASRQILRVEQTCHGRRGTAESDPLRSWAARAFRNAKALFVPSLKRDIIPLYCMHTTSGGRGRMAIHIRRRKFIFTLGGAAAAWPLAARAQQPALPVVGYLNFGSPESDAPRLTGLRRGLSQTGYIEGRNLVVE